MSFSSVRVFSSSCRRFIFHASSGTKLFSQTDLNVRIKSEIFRCYCKESITVTFKLPDGTMAKRTGKVGDTVRSVVIADDPQFPGYGGCFGTKSCGGCHVILSEEDYEKVGEADEPEEDELCQVALRAPTSRLACGMTLGPEIDGIILKIPFLQKK